MRSKGSYDGSIFIWRESDTPDTSAIGWHRIEVIKENFGSVEDIKFAPSFCGLKLAAAHSEPCVLVYDLSKSGKLANRSATLQVGKGQVCSISWNKNQLDPSMLAMGSHKQLSGVYEECLSIFAKENEGWREVYQFATNEKLETPSSILDVSWALRHGRQFHYILACSISGVYIFKLVFDYGSEGHEIGAPVRATNVLDIRFIPNNPGATAIRGAWNYMVA